MEPVRARVAISNLGNESDPLILSDLFCKIDPSHTICFVTPETNPNFGKATDIQAYAEFESRSKAEEAIKTFDKYGVNGHSMHLTLATPMEGLTEKERMKSVIPPCGGPKKFRPVNFKLKNDPQ